jgi:hypothetical protein
VISFNNLIARMPCMNAGTELSFTLPRFNRLSRPAFGSLKRPMALDVAIGSGCMYAGSLIGLLYRCTSIWVVLV